MIARICAHCHGDMTGRRRDAVYCSRRCKTGASDQRRIADGRSRTRDRARYHRDPDERREYATRTTRDLRAAVMAHYGRKCAACLSTQRLELDHVHGNGGEHRRAVGRGTAFYAWLLRARFPRECSVGGRFELQVLCRDCHLEKTQRQRKERR